MANVQRIGMAELQVAKGYGVLSCTGLGSGIAVCAFDVSKHIAGIAHVMLPTSFAGPAVRVAGNGAGISSNATARVGGSYSPVKGFSLLAEPFVFLTRHQLDDNDDFAAGRVGYGIEAGALYSF